jgi:hypothetical protein
MFSKLAKTVITRSRFTNKISQQAHFTSIFGDETGFIGKQIFSRNALKLTQEHSKFKNVYVVEPRNKGRKGKKVKVDGR